MPVLRGVFSKVAAGRADNSRASSWSEAGTMIGQAPQGLFLLSSYPSSMAFMIPASLPISPLNFATMPRFVSTLFLER